jgi:glycerol-3-phosphate dehydrogenase
MVCNLKDFFVRRTGLVYFDIHKVRKWKEVIAQECKDYFSWDVARTSRELTELEGLIKELTNFG